MADRARARCRSRPARRHPEFTARRRPRRDPPANDEALMVKTTNMGGGTGRKSDRDLKVRVKTSKGRKIGSTIWLQRQLNDPSVARAKAEGYRSRAAYKIMELNERYKLFHKGMRVVDLGAAPGGWSQVAAPLLGSTPDNPL